MKATAFPKKVLLDRLLTNAAKFLADCETASGDPTNVLEALGAVANMEDDLRRLLNKMQSGTDFSWEDLRLCLLGVSRHCTKILEEGRP